MTAAKRIALPIVTALVAVGLAVAMWSLNTRSNDGGTPRTTKLQGEPSSGIRNTPQLLVECMGRHGLKVTENAEGGGWTVASSVLDGKDAQRAEDAHSACEHELGMDQRPSVSAEEADALRAELARQDAEAAKEAASR